MTLLALALAAHGATFDPDLRWRTLQTEHFEVHFHQGEAQLAEELSLELERMAGGLHQEMGWTPRGRTQLTLVDRTDLANGYASAVPYRAIVVYPTAPDATSNLDLYQSWLPSIAIHEYTHILHLDTHGGLVTAARWVVGRAASTNSLSPGWMVEGQAVRNETRFTEGGRGREPTAQMVKRAAVLDGAFPPLGSLDGFQPDPPAGNLRYLFGEDLVSYIASRSDEQVWTRWNHTYGSSVPWLLPGRWVFDAPLPALYRDWHAEVEERYHAEEDALIAEGLAEGARVSDPSASCAAPAYSPDGERLIWSCTHLDTGPAIWLANADGSGAEVLLDHLSARSFTWRGDSQAVAYAGIQVVNRFNAWSDVFLYELEEERLSLLTAGERASDPDFSPDGGAMVVVTNRAQENQLELRTVDRQRRVLAAPGGHTSFSQPRFSPDGAVLAVSVHQDEARDLWLYTADGAPLRRLTHDSAREWAPAWSADGRWLYFASTRTGVPQIHAIDLRTEREYQVTRVRTGASMPSPHPDGERLAYQEYHAHGWEVRVLDLDRAAWTDLGPVPPGQPPLTARSPAPREARAWPTAAEPSRAGGAPVDPLSALSAPGTPRALALPAPYGEGLDTLIQVEVDDAFGPEEDYPFTLPVRRYSPVRTLRPRYALPWVMLSPWPSKAPLGTLPWGAVAGVSSSATDAVKRYGWRAGASWRTDAGAGTAWASVVINRWLPVYGLAASTAAVPVGRLPMLGEDGAVVAGDGPYWERREQLSASVSYPYSHRSTVFARYALTRRGPLEALPEGVATEALPIQGQVGTVQGGWAYAFTRPTAHAVSQEDGRVVSIVGGLIHPWLGTAIEDQSGTPQPLTQGQLTAELREYAVNPWVPNHVLSLRAAGGLTVGPSSAFGTYQLGGSIGDAAVTATPDEFRMLRGYPIAADMGDMYWLTGLEYRMPLWRIERGLGIWPVYLRTLSLRAFTDAGDAFTQADDLGRAALVGSGAELHLAGIYGWTVPTTARLGYAMGWSEGGFKPGSPEGLYFQLGGTW
ncbi:MAG: PD40 domain-containing protein [Deltaproteobacteria bacterium]|nr:PD40 domain-containing protein [Deltaproteobacteria bacterium]